MGSSPTLSPQFTAAFQERAGAGGVLTFAGFMELALYHPALGYYRQTRNRVGYGQGTDFYTATSSGTIFGEMVAAACVTLLGGTDQAREHTFVEIGAEPAGGVLTGVAHPFAGTRTVRVGEALEISGPCVVFSNELFDAQPLRRFVRRGMAWRELGVQLKDGILSEIELGEVTAEWLPGSVNEGYVFDAPQAAAELAVAIAAQPWTGLFVAFDYGKSLSELATDTPAGTARAYFQHKQSNDLFAQPGEQDLTGHVCWDWLTTALDQSGFRPTTVESQESFFIHHAGEFVAHAMAAEASRLSQRKLALMQLLHPSYLGQKFQVLHGLRKKV
ncbi:MAG: SAM-dependent methyltransferase [Opitutaceae bacterium]|jgi:SAM-dependent MidA family methyltransferase